MSHSRRARSFKLRSVHLLFLSAHQVLCWSEGCYWLSLRSVVLLMVARRQFILLACRVDPLDFLFSKTALSVAVHAHFTRHMLNAVRSWKIHINAGVHVCWCRQRWIGVTTRWSTPASALTGHYKSGVLLSLLLNLRSVVSLHQSVLRARHVDVSPKVHGGRLAWVSLDVYIILLIIDIHLRILPRVIQLFIPLV